MLRHKLRRRRTRGEALIEFTLLGIPMLFVFVSIEEMARGMWQYHTLQFAVKAAASYASLHGATCSSGTNSCSVNVSSVVNVFSSNAIGVPMSNVALTLTSENASVTCSQVSTCSTNASWSTTWPPSANGDNAVGNWIKIRADYTFNTALAMFWPHGGTAKFSSASGNGKFDFPGYSMQYIQF
jgi:Flp pilus assembly protein TadG